VGRLERRSRKFSRPDQVGHSRLAGQPGGCWSLIGLVRPRQG
jgi:hypothetical protein